ncbi:MAG: tetratricopeptide repeat protein [Gemmatimonadetes bacterium]|nr:tetratricopeptide repeat protein [Gemmatimonadota bacterium]
MNALGILLHSLKSRGRMSILVLAIGLIGFFFHCRAYNLTQDDAFITFTYARNLAEGEGLVFNEGERVEGYTSFLWTVGMAIPHLIGIDVEATAKALGFTFAAGLFVATLLLSVHIRPTAPPILGDLALLFLAANGALAVWTFSGMETTLFVFLITLGAYQHSRELDRDGRWTALIFGLAALTRPEGIFFFGLTFLHRLGVHLYRRQFIPRDAILWTLPFLGLVLPHFLFRLAYYGYPFPNTFYAKAGATYLHLEHGLKYAEKFTSEYGFWGLLFLIPLIQLIPRRHRIWSSYQALLILGNALYIVAIGGDALMGNRFFLTTLPLIYLALQNAFLQLADLLENRIQRPWRLAVQLCIVAVAAAGIYQTYARARPALRRDVRMNRAHNNSLRELADFINEQISSDRRLVVATSTIGIPAYYTDAYILDLVGLTDRFISHHPQEIEGLEAPFIYRKYNVEYVLDRQPDILFFVTGVKPVHLAEKALFLYPRFRRNYYAHFISDTQPVFLKRPDFDPELSTQRFPRTDFIDYYIRGFNVANGGDAEAALELFRKSIETGPPDFASPYLWIGVLQYKRGKMNDAYQNLSKALEIDPFAVKAHTFLAIIDITYNLFDSALEHARRAAALSPGSHHSQVVLGIALLKNGRPEEAIQPLLKAVDLDGPHALDATSHLGEAFRQIGEIEKSKKAWEIVLSVDPNHPLTRGYISAAAGDQ